MSASARPALVTDSTSYLPMEFLREHEVQVVSLYVGLEGEQTPEVELLDDLDGFYERLRASEQGVTTSQPSVGDFLAVYEPLLAEGREIVSIHIAAGISGTCETALQARERLIADGKGGERIHVVDSGSGAGGSALVVLGAVRAAEQGASAAAVAEAAERASSNLGLYFAVDTLEYLRRGGRIGAAGAWIGTTLKIKPILAFEGEVKPVERVRTRARSIERLVGYAQQGRDAGADVWVVQHIQDPEAAERLIETCGPIFGHDPDTVAEMGPVIGAHLGPGALGIGTTSFGTPAAG